MKGGRKGKTCPKCSTKLPPSRRIWCSDACSNWWWSNHRYSQARKIIKNKSRKWVGRKVKGYLCSLCSIITNKIEIDHIVRAMGKHAELSCLHHLTNLRPLCVPCHRQVTKEQRNNDRK